METLDSGFPSFLVENFAFSVWKSLIIVCKMFNLATMKLPVYILGRFYFMFKNLVLILCGERSCFTTSKSLLSCWGLFFFQKVAVHKVGRFFLFFRKILSFKFFYFTGENFLVVILRLVNRFFIVFELTFPQ